MRQLAGITGSNVSAKKNAYQSHSPSKRTRRVMAFCLPNPAGLKTMELVKKNQKDLP